MDEVLTQGARVISMGEIVEYTTYPTAIDEGLPGRYQARGGRDVGHMGRSGGGQRHLRPVIPWLAPGEFPRVDAHTP